MRRPDGPERHDEREPDGPEVFTMKLWSRSATGYLSNELGSAALFFIAIAILAGGCNHPRSKDDGDTTAISAGSQLSQALVGKRITIRGGLFRFKCGPGIQFDDGAVVCLVDVPLKSGLDDPYAEMYEKLVKATGTLRFYHASTPLDGTRSTQGQHDHYYFERETTQARIIANYTNDAAASAARSKLSALVGKRTTIRGKLQDFGFPVCLAIQLDDEEVVCLEDKRPKPISNPYPEMFEKRVEATGTLRFFHDPTVMDENIPTSRIPDHYYFETETTQVRLIANYADNTTAPSAVSQLSQTLVGKRITIRGKLLGFKCGLGIQLDDEEVVCLEFAKSVEDPYPGMFEKRVEATGTLRFYHNPTPLKNEPVAFQRADDHYYFEEETTQVRLSTWTPPGG